MEKGKTRPKVRLFPPNISKSSGKPYFERFLGSEALASDGSVNLKLILMAFVNESLSFSLGLNCFNNVLRCAFCCLLT